MHDGSAPALIEVLTFPKLTYRRQGDHPVDMATDLWTVQIEYKSGSNHHFLEEINPQLEQLQDDIAATDPPRRLTECDLRC